MNILYIDHYAGSISMGMEFRPYYLAREWQKMGHNVRILAADFSHLRTRQPEASGNFCKETIDGVEYQIIRAGTYAGNGAKRACSMFRFVGSLWMRAGELARDFNPDVVITSSTYPLDAYAGNRIARKSKAKYVHEAHDVWPLTLIELGGMSEKHPFVVILDRAEKYAYIKADKVVSVLPGTLPHMLEQGLQSEEKFIYIPNGIVMEDWENSEPLAGEHRELLDKLHGEGKIIIGYIGGHALSNALDQLLNAAKIVADDNIAFVLVGKGIEKPRLQKRIGDEGIGNVFFLPAIPKIQVPSALQEMDALYIGAAKSPLYRFGVSMNKLYDYMMSGKPILNGVVASNNEVEEAECGFSFDSSKPEEIAQAIGKIKAMPGEELEKMGKRGSHWVRENCDYTILAKKFLDCLER